MVTMARRLCLACLMATVVSLALSMPALAALWVRVSLDPGTPTAGESVHVSVFTFYLTSNRCWDDPAASPIPNAIWYGGVGGSTPQGLDLRIAARGPGSRQIQVALSQRSDDRAYWDGNLVFPTAGDWTLLVLAFGAQPDWSHAADYRCSGLTRTIRVVGARGETMPPTSRPVAAGQNSALPMWLLIGAALVAVAVAIALLRRVRRSLK